MPPPDPTTNPNATPGGIPGLLGNLFPGNNPAALYGGLLSDPATQQQLNQRALAAMAGSFAESAMPTRVPTPFGAVLGRAAAATGPAQDAVMAARLQNAQAQQELALASLTQGRVGLLGNIAQHQAAYDAAAGPPVAGTIGAENPTTAPHDAGPGWMAGYTIPSGTATATPDPKKSGTENLQNLANAAMPIALPGYTIKLVSGERPGAEVGGGGGESQHAKGNAADFQIFRPDGTPIDKEGPDSSGAYGKLALTMRMIASPDIKPWLGWGGNFSTRADNDVRDLMHFDFAGDRGRFGSLAQMEQQWVAANQQQPGGPTLATGPGAPQVAAAGTTISTPGSWFGNSPGWTDKTDRGPQANGQPVSAGPGIALPTPRDSPQFGGWYDVTMPNGKTLRLQQTDVGPGVKGRGIDINSVAAAQFGYTPATFPTDEPIRYRPATGPGAAPPVQLAANVGATDVPGLLGRGGVAAPAPGAPPVAPGAAPPAGPPPGALPPGPPPQGPAGPLPSLVTPPPPAAPVPPIAMPQVAQAAPQAVATGAVPAVPGAPSPARIAAAKQLVRDYTAMGWPVPPDLAAEASWDIKAAEAQRDALIKFYTTPQRPGSSTPLPGGGYTTAPGSAAEQYANELVNIPGYGWIQRKNIPGFTMPGSGGTGAAPAPTALPAGPGSPAPGTPTTPGRGAVLPSETPAQTEIFKQQLADTTAQLAPLRLEKQAAPTQQANADAINDLLGRTALGWGANTKNEAGMILKTLGVSDENVKKFLGVDTAAGGDLNKLFLKFSSDAVRSLGAHEAASVLGQFNHAYPSLESDPNAAQLMTNALRMEATWRFDRANAAEAWNGDQMRNAGPFGQNYRGLEGFDKSFASTNSPRDYWRAAVAMSDITPGKPSGIASDIAWKGTSAADQQAIYNLIPAGRTFRYVDGKLYTKPGA